MTLNINSEIKERLGIRLHHFAKSTGLRSGANNLRFGPNAPRPDQLFQLPPQLILDNHRPGKLNQSVLGARHSGQVRNGDWDLARGPLHKTRKFRACVRHFRDGLSWKDTGIYDLLAERIAEHGEVDQCRNYADVVSRYDALDRLWEATINGAGLLSQVTKVQYAKDGILIHIDRNGAPLFGNQGFHRLAIAKLAKVEQITVILGRTHGIAVRNGDYATLKHSNGC